MPSWLPPLLLRSSRSQGKTSVKPNTGRLSHHWWEGMTSFPGHREQSTWPGNKAIRGAYLAGRMAVKGEAFVSGFRN